MNRKGEARISWWVSVGNFLLGFSLFAYGFSLAASRAMQPIFQNDESGAALSGWGPVLLLFLFLVAVVGGILAVMLARIAHRSKWRVVISCTSVLGIVIFVYQVVELAFAMFK